jgi:hypothetical protein
MSDSLSYRIMSWANLYNDNWVVIRMRDEHIVNSGSLHSCLAWVRTWAPLRGQQVAGQPLSPRATLWP